MGCSEGAQWFETGHILGGKPRELRQSIGAESFLAQRIGHPRREWKPEIQQGRGPPLDELAC
jgi:hypothetical protein